MLADSLFLVSVFAAMFAIIDPVGTVPILMALTDNYSRVERLDVINKGILTASGLVLGFMFVGKYIFEVLSINISDFMIAGGILLFIVAIDMMFGRTSRAKLTPGEEQESLQKGSVGIVPIGTPLLAGPGAITTAIIYFNIRSIGVVDQIGVFLMIILVLIVSYFILRYSMIIFERLGRTGSLILSRIMGLVLAAIGVSFVISGITAIIPTI